MAWYQADVAEKGLTLTHSQCGDSPDNTPSLITSSPDAPGRLPCAEEDPARGGPQWVPPTPVRDWARVYGDPVSEKILFSPHVAIAAGPGQQVADVWPQAGCGQVGALMAAEHGPGILAELLGHLFRHAPGAVAGAAHDHPGSAAQLQPEALRHLRQTHLQQGTPTARDVSIGAQFKVRQFGGPAW